MNDWVRTALAFIVVPTVLVVTIVFWIQLTPMDGMDFAGIFTGIVGLIIGFYFGNKGVQQSENRARAAQQQVDAMTQRAYDAESTLKAITAVANADPQVKAKLGILI